MKFIRIAASLVLIVASVQGYAGKPPPDQQKVYSAPLTGNVFDCWAFNATDAAILGVFIGVVRQDGTLADFEVLNVDDGETVGWGAVENNAVAHCEIIWTGQRDDLRASFCSYSDPTTHDGRTCIKVE